MTPEQRETLIDQWHIDKFGVSKHDYQAYQAHKSSAKQRGIPFNFTLLAWKSWWNVELSRIGQHAVRGKRRGEYMMCRIGDLGAYEPGNVYAGTHSDNAREPHLIYDRSVAMKARHAAEPCYLIGKTGKDHPKSKPVITPKGTFPSISEASKAHGISRQGGHYAVRSGRWQLA